MGLGGGVGAEVGQQVPAGHDVPAVPRVAIAVGGQRAAARHDGLLRVHPAQHGADHRIGGGGLGGGGGRGAFQQPGHHGGDHLDVPDLLGRDVHDQVFVLAGHPAIPALEQVLHGDGHLAVGAADQLLQLVRIHRVGLVGLGLELQARGVPEHQQRPHFPAGPAVTPMVRPGAAGCAVGPLFDPGRDAAR